VFFAKQSVLTDSSPIRIIVKNDESFAVKLTGLAISGTDAADFTETSNCLESLDSQATCTISVFFRPTGSGTRTAILSIGSSRRVNLAGIGN